MPIVEILEPYWGMYDPFADRLVTPPTPLPVLPPSQMVAENYLGSCFIAYVDGSIGSWGAVIQYEIGGVLKTVELGRAEAPNATSNTMELTGILRVLESIKGNPRPIVICTDSNNAIQWSTGVFRCRTAHLIPLVKAIGQEGLSRLVMLAHVKGHEGNPLNERAHSLAYGLRWMETTDHEDH